MNKFTIAILATVLQVTNVMASDVLSDRIDAVQRSKDNLLLAKSMVDVAQKSLSANEEELSRVLNDDTLLGEDRHVTPKDGNCGVAVTVVEAGKPSTMQVLKIANSSAVTVEVARPFVVTSLDGEDHAVVKIDQPAAPAKSAASKAIETVKPIVQESVQKVETLSKQAATSAKSVAVKTADGAKSVATKTADGAKSVATKTADVAKSVATKTADSVKSATTSAVNHVKSFWESI
jgi:hypothetical protein